MKRSSSGQAGQAVERVLELSADAQITRRKAPKDSPAFHRLTGAIAAYGKALAILTALQAREECCSIIAQYELSEQSVAATEQQNIHKGDQFWESELVNTERAGNQKETFCHGLFEQQTRRF
jgi:hypothetical protein